MAHFYIIQVAPEYQPERMKLGITHDTQMRLDSYRAICPEARVLHTWPCKVTWEQAAIASITRTDCKRIGQELFLCSDMDAMIQRGHEFFRLMPSE